jgi:Ca2+/Na+ antiporter
MLLGVLLLVLAAIALVAGSALLGGGLESVALGRRAPGGVVRSVAIGLGGPLAATVIAVARNQMALASGVPFGAAMFVLAAGFGALALLGRRPIVVGDPVLYAAPAAGIVLAALSVANDRSFSRWSGALLAIVFVPYLLWVLLEPGRESSLEPGQRPDAESVQQPGAEPAQPPDAEPVPNEPRPRIGGALGRVGIGAVVVTGGAFALVEGTIRVGVRAKLAPGFAGAALAGSLVALPFVLLVLFPRRPRPDDDPGVATLTAVAGLVTFVPGVAALVRPFELDGPAAISLLAVALLYAVAGTWMLVRGRSDRVLGAVTLLVYAACLVIAGSL